MSIELPGTPQQVIEVVQILGLEGVIAKRKTSRYTSGRAQHRWVKLKLDKQQEFVIGDIDPDRWCGCAFVGYYEGKELRFAGQVRAGFTPHVRREVFARLKPLPPPSARSPTSRTVSLEWGAGVTPEQMRDMQWLTPNLVAQVRFVEWTTDGHLRHAAFLGLGSDKTAKGIRRET